MLTIAVCRFRPFDGKYDVTRCTNDHIISILKTITAQVISAHSWNFNAASERLYTAAQLGAKWLTEHGSFQRSTMKMAQYMPARKP